MRAFGLLVSLLIVSLGFLLSGCTAESVRVALETQRRADDVQRAVVERQHDGLRLLLFRDALARLREAAGEQELTDALNQAWNERDLVEFWMLQFERAASLRMIGVDAKLYADQSIVDLLLKQIQLRAGRMREGLAEAAAERAASQMIVPPSGSVPPANVPSVDAQP